MTSLKSKFKKCRECEEEKQLNRFSRNVAMEDGFNDLCKKCQAVRNGVDNNVTLKEKSILLKYVPYLDKNGYVITSDPGANVDEIEPITMADIARDNDVSFSVIQSAFYKFTRLGLTTMIVKGNCDQQIDILVHYKMDNIKDFIFNDE